MKNQKSLETKRQTTQLTDDTCGKGAERLFKYDTHAHTEETSPCSYVPAARLTDAYKALGYHGFIVTDHMYGNYINRLFCKNDWDACVDQFLKGYNAAKKQGDKIGINVLLGMEIRFDAYRNDFLIYGIDEAFLKRTPYPYKMTPQDYFKQFKDEILMIQAHPFRDGNQRTFERYVHGLEVNNAHPRHTNRNDLAQKLHQKNAHLFPMAGSDAHILEDVGGASIMLEHKVCNAFDFRDAILNKKYKIC